jgi:hypothetical protein
VLKERADKLRRKRGRLEAQLPLAKERDQIEQADYERKLADAQKSLPKVRQSITAFKADRQNYHHPFSLLDTIFSIRRDDELRPEAAAKLRELEIEEYLLEIALGLEKERIEIDTHRYDARLRRKPYDHRILQQTRLRSTATHEQSLRKEIAALGSELSLYEEALGEHDASLAELEAFKARALQESRALAQRLRLQCQPTDDCPYCGDAIGSEPRLDHIYPVSKGGLSVRTNLVFVCLDCNQRKTDMTLAAFLRAFSLDRGAIEARLTVLGKEF